VVAGVFSPRYSVKERRKELSRKATPAEQRLMAGLRLLWEGKGIAWEFQKPIGPFYADFAVPVAKLVIEVDDGYHAELWQQHRDAERTKYLEDKGWEVRRYTNEIVEKELAWVVIDIGSRFGARC
jgi:very-short-patch-repair endonuclease